LGRPDVRRADGRRRRCAQLGRVDGDRFLRVGDLAPLSLADPTAACIAPGRNPRREPVSRIDTFVDDASAYAPRPVRTVVWGTAGPAGRRVDAGGQRVPLGSDGAFLAFFAPSLTDRDLVVRTTYADGTTHSVERFRKGRTPPSRIEARSPDPDAGAPYGLLVWRDADDRLCQEVGRVVGDTVGTLDTRSGIFRPYPVHEGGSCGEPPSTRAHPVSWSVTAGPGAEGSSLLRTLPGRTIVSGFLHPAVRELTIRTPRDVRTLRPVGDTHAFLAVYDGEFFGGVIELTARFADGTTHTETLPLGGP
jgi:hypothetical protein